MNVKEQIGAIRGSGRRQIPELLQREVIRHVAEQRRRGRTVREITNELGVSEQRLSYWRQKAKKRIPVPFRPVVVRAQPSQVVGELVLELGASARVRGLSMAQVAELLRALG